MSLTKSIQIAGFLAASMIVTPVIAGTIVIRSSGPSARNFPVGKSLPDGQRVALKAGDTLVLLDARGTRTLNGAGSYDIGASARGSAAPSALTTLIASSGARQVRTGAVRGTNSAPPRIASLWYVDTTRSGTVCLRDMSRASMWRATMTDPATMTLTRTSDGKSVSVTFATGQAVRSWPVKDMPIVAGGEYRLAGPGMARPTILHIAAFTGTTDAPDDVASHLIAQGCTGQLDVLVDAGRVAQAEG